MAKTRYCQLAQEIYLVYLSISAARLKYET